MVESIPYNSRKSLKTLKNPSKLLFLCLNYGKPRVSLVLLDGS